MGSITDLIHLVTGRGGSRRSLVSLSILFLVVLAEIEGLAYLALGLLLGRPDLFIAAQGALFPAAWLVAAAAVGGLLWRMLRWEARRRRDASSRAELSEVADSFRASNWRQRIGM